MLLDKFIYSTPSLLAFIQGIFLKYTLNEGIDIKIIGIPLLYYIYLN